MILVVSVYNFSFKLKNPEIRNEKILDVTITAMTSSKSLTKNLQNHPDTMTIVTGKPDQRSPTKVKLKKIW